MRSGDFLLKLHSSAWKVLLLQAPYISFILITAMDRSSWIFLQWYPIIVASYLYFIYHAERGGFEMDDMKVFWISSILIRFFILVFPVGLSDDIYRYVWDGRVQAAGINPFLHSPDSPELYELRTDWWDMINNPHVITPYPAFSQLVFFLLLGNVADINLAILIFRAFSVFVDLGILYMMDKILILLKKPRRYLLYYSFSPLALMEFAGNGHNDALAVLFMVIPLYLHLKYAESYPLSIPVFLALAVMTKSFPLLIFPFLIGNWRIKHYIAFLLTIIILSLPYLSHGILPFLPPGQIDFVRYFEFNSSVYRLFRPLNTGLARGITSALILTAITGILLSFLRNARKNDILDYITWAFLVVFFLTPDMHPWYVLWVLPLGIIVKNWTAISFSITVVLSYAIYPMYDNYGVWEENTLILFLEYFPVYLILIWTTIFPAMKRKLSARIV